MYKITLTLKELEELLTEQKKCVGDYITNNLSKYQWYCDHANDIDLDLAKKQLEKNAKLAPYPHDISILKKYLT